MLIETDENKLIVGDFYASWCGPCKMIAPAYEEMAESEQYADVTFVKVYSVYLDYFNYNS